VIVDGVPIAAVLKRKTKKDLAGFQLMQEKKYAEAKDMFLASLQEYPGNELVWAEMVRLYAAEGKMDSVTYAGKKALSKNPGDINVYQTMGDILLKNKQVEEALKLYSELEKYNPGYGHFFKAYTYAVSGNANAAFSEIDLSIAADPYNEQSYKLAIQLAQQTRDMNRAEEYNAKAQKLFGAQEEQ
jgi:Tfp pilus assembly protein PilF